MSIYKSVAIIGAGEIACDFAQKARKMGIATHCFAWQEGAIAKEHVDYFYPISIFEKERISEICKKKKINGVLATTELTISICAFIQEKLNLPRNISYNNSLNITNKGWVREKSQNVHSFNHPLFIRTHGFSCNWSLFPAIVKPASEGGKRGVIVVNNITELKNALKYSLSYDKHSNGVIIEEFLNGGKEYSVESLSFQGRHEVIQITEKISSGPPHCVELGHHQPAELSSSKVDSVKTAINDLLNCVAFENGITHTELKIINDKIYLIELNARPGGDFIANTLTQLSTGYDYLGEAIKVAIGIKPSLRDIDYIKYAGVYFVTKQTESLKAVFDACDNEEWLYRKHVENEELNELVTNDDLHQNYIIYYSDKRIDLSKEGIR